MQRFALTDLRDLDTLPFDEVIDVRSPAEFAEDHIPGAVNLPVLDNAERAEVGTLYVQTSRFEARKLGAALVSKNAALHLQAYLADKPGNYRPLVYCWRGGQRSGSFAVILDQIGWRVGLLDGGWRSWRRLVSTALYETPFQAPVVVLDGNTGTAKTKLLAQVRARGGQVIDLEALAGHRGSLFGLPPGTQQPSQKAFESGIAQQMARLDPTRPVLVEAESNKIGERRIPPSLWQAMQVAPRIELTAPLDARARFLVNAYSDIIADAPTLTARIWDLAPYHARSVIEDWQDKATTGAFEALARDLMAQHYDPRYARTKLRQGAKAARVMKANDLSEASLDGLADQLMAQLENSIFSTSES